MKIKILAVYLIITNPKLRIIVFIIISFAVSALGFNEAITTSSNYNSIASNNPCFFAVNQKYNKKSDWKPFPNLKIKGTIIQNQDTVEIKVSRGDFDHCKIGDTITVFKIAAEDRYITQYEINNQLLMKIGGKSYSFVFIPAIIFIIAGFLAVLYYMKKYA